MFEKIQIEKYGLKPARVTVKNERVRVHCDLNAEVISVHIGFQPYKPKSLYLEILLGLLGGKREGKLRRVKALYPREIPALYFTGGGYRIDFAEVYEASGAENNQQLLSSIFLQILAPQVSVTIEPSGKVRNVLVTLKLNGEMVGQVITRFDSPRERKLSNSLEFPPIFSQATA